MIFNGGLQKFDAAKYEKPDDMGYDEFCKILEKLKERHRQSKYFMIVFMPFFMVFLIDYLLIKWKI
jgi:predicted nucleic acid-binding Zn ribbon protein